jgi:hypothetical protein
VAGAGRVRDLAIPRRRQLTSAAHKKGRQAETCRPNKQTNYFGKHVLEPSSHFLSFIFSQSTRVGAGGFV